MNFSSPEILNRVMVEECQDVRHLWDDQMRAFLLGCSFTWEDVLAAAQLRPRHIEEGRNVPMYNTSIPLKGAGPFQGQMVVSMRPYKVEDSDKVAEITGRYPAAHGQPVQVGQPSVIGVQDIAQPDYGQAVSVRDGEVPIFWACGVTPQNALRNAKLPLVITHAPGHMFVADITNDQLRSWKVPGEWKARPAEEPTASVPSHEEVRASASPSVHKTVAAVPLTSIASGGVSISASNASTALSSRTPTSSAPRPAPRAPEPLPTMGAATDSLQFVGQCQVQLPSSVVQGEAQPPRPQVEAVAESLFALGPRVEARVFVEEDSCPACGTSYLPDSVFCRNCGRKRDQAPQSTARLSGRQELVPQSSAPLSRAQEVPPQSSVHLSRAQEVKPQGTPRLSRAQVSTRTMARNSSEGPRSLSPPMRPLSAPRNLSREALPWTPSPAQRGYPNFVFQPSGPASPQPVKFAPQPLSPGPPGIMRAVSPLVRPLQPLPLNSPAVRRTISGPKSKGDTVYVAQNSCRTAAVRTTGVVQDIGWRMVVMIMRMTQKILRKRKGNIMTMLLPLVLQWWRAGGGGSSGGGGGDDSDCYVERLA
eukprot:s453_g4.t1